MKYTTGNWYASCYSHNYLVGSDEGDGRDIAIVRIYNDEEESRGNKLLIENAPRMYRALQAIVARGSGEFDHPALEEFGDLGPNAGEDMLLIAERTLNSIHYDT